MPITPTDFNELVHKHAPWSATKVSCANQCGIRFQWKYIEKKREGPAERTEGRVGVAAHKVVELVLKGEDLKRAFVVASVDNKLTTNEIDDLATFKGSIQKFLERIKAFTEKNPAEKKLVEHQFGVTIDLKPTGFFAKNVFFRGAFDLALVLTKGDAIILDHKSGNPEATVDKYTDQLNSYALAGKVLFPTINGVQSALHYLKDGSVVWGSYTSAQEIDDRVQKWFVEYLNGAAASLNLAEAKTGWWCGYCGYASQCPAYQTTKKSSP